MSTTLCRLALVPLLLLQAQAPLKAQSSDCIHSVRTTVTTSAWEDIRSYFASLVVSPSQRNKAQLIRLRANIVQLEAEKQRLIDVLMAHAVGDVSGTPATSSLASTQIPSILEHISSITSELKSMAMGANLFAAEPAFRELVVTLEGKRGRTLCSLSREAAGGFIDKDAVKRLAAELESELAAIIAAEDTLATYIRKLP